MTTLPDFSFEKPLWDKKYLVIGVDEVGRGAFAGPIYASAVCFYPPWRKDSDWLTNLGINDSKLLSPEKRRELSLLIKKNCLSYTISSVNVSLINKKGIGYANNLVLRKAVCELIKKLGSIVRPYILSDGFKIKYMKKSYSAKHKSIIHGDAKSITIAAASIIAKVERDRFMKNLAIKYPKYMWSKNKGYGTKEHLQNILKFGSCEYHRKDYLKTF